MPASRKLNGLIIVMAALLLLFVAYVVASFFVNVSEVVMTGLVSAISSLGLGHQGAQAMADRSPYYNPPPAQPLFAPKEPEAPKPPNVP